MRYSPNRPPRSIRQSGVTATSRQVRFGQLVGCSETLASPRNSRDNEALMSRPAVHRRVSFFVLAVHFDFRLTGSVNCYPPTAEEQLLRIAQEAVANITRHSGATRFRVEVTIREGDAIVLQVIDDVRGFN